jgi:hypothetical protein
LATTIKILSPKNNAALAVGVRGRGVLAEPVAGADGVWLQDRATNMMVINSVFTLDRMDIKILRELWMERVMDAGEGRRYPRFRQRVVDVKGKAFWEEDADFDIARHIVLAPGLEERIYDKSDLQKYIGGAASKPLPTDRPLWQFLLIPDFSDGCSAVVSRVHHVLGDGIAMVQVMFSMMDSSPEGGDMVLPAVVDRDGKPPNKLLLGLKALLAGPLILGRKMLWRADPAPLHGPELCGEKQVAWTEPLDLDMVKAVKNRLGGTVNDILVACVAGAFRRYLEESGQQATQLQVSMPVNVRSRAEELKMDNKFAAVLLSLPIHIRDPHARTHATKAQLDTLKRSIEPFTTYGVVRVMLRTLPASWSRGLIDFLGDKCTCVLSNVPGPQAPVYMAGHRMRAMLFWVPQRSKVGIGVSIFSYDGTLRLGVIADRALLPEPDRLVAAFEEEFLELKATV